jgi:hypothetical protein
MKVGAEITWAHPHAVKQGTVCSGWLEGERLCVHGHIQTLGCNPYKDRGYPSRKEWWLPGFLPTCVIDDK